MDEIKYHSINNNDLNNNQIENIENMSFREAMTKLNDVVAKLESNTLELEESLDQYKYGVELLAHLKRSLNSAQVQVEELMGKIEADVVSDTERDTTIS